MILGMNFQIGFTNKKITPCGDRALMKKIMDRSGIDNLLSFLDLPIPGLNRGYKPGGIIKSFVVSVLCGANRSLHTELTRQDTYKRFFSKFS